MKGCGWSCWRSVDVRVELNGSLSGHTLSSITITFLVLDYEIAVSRSLLGRHDLRLKSFDPTERYGDMTRNKATGHPGHPGPLRKPKYTSPPAPPLVAWSSLVTILCDQHISRLGLYVWSMQARRQYNASQASCKHRGKA